jgi:hypothetical protein
MGEEKVEVEENGKTQGNYNNISAIQRCQLK